MTIVPKITREPSTDGDSDYFTVKVKLNTLLTNNYKIKHSGGIDGIQAAQLSINNLVEPLPVQNEYSFLIKNGDALLLLLSTPNGVIKFRL